MQRRTALLIAWLGMLPGMPTLAAEMPITIEAARRLSLEEPRLYLESSPYWLRSAYSAAHPEWRRELLLRRGRAAWLLSDRVLARDAVLSLNELARSADMPLAAAYAMILEADELTDYGQYTAAIERVSEAASILRATKEPYWRAIANAELCDVYWGTEQGESAMPYCRRAEKYFRSTSDDWYLGRIENALAMLQDAAGRPADADVSFKAAIQRQREALDRAGDHRFIRQLLSKHYYNYAESLANRGEFAVAREAALERRDLWPNDPSLLLSAAEQLATFSQRARNGAKEEAQTREADAAAVAAVETLRSAIAAGLETPRLNSPALASLANRSDFIALRQTASVAEQPVEDLAGK